MNICIVGPGIMDIPPKGWGAVESIIWESYKELSFLGYEVTVINTQDLNKAIEIIKNNNFDFIHIHYDVYYYLISEIKNIFPKIKIGLSSHYPFIDQFNKHQEDGYDKIFEWMISNNDIFYNFCVSEKDLKTFKYKNDKLNNLHLFKTGAQHRDIKISKDPKYKDRTICLGKIDLRKMQYFYQKLDSIDFVGPIGYMNNFNTDKNYLGEWTRSEVSNNLTEYANTALFSLGENGTPLVFKEALIAGLGIVTSEYCASELNLDLPFIDIIPNNKLQDLDYVNKVLLKNREISINMRPDIRDYGIKNFSWEQLIINYSEQIKKLI